ncbi:MAG: PEGA domain-containing protein [Gracilimonas sp.]|nr:PEGA domain-containing protein [Gracilimonas sp.]
MYIHQSLHQISVIILCAIFGASIFTPLHAQNNGEDEIATMRVVGDAKKLSGEIIADRDDNRDINGNLTAGLRVISNLTGLTFQSNNGIHKIQQLPGYNLLYLSTNERVVSIYKDGFPPLQIVLNDEGINLAAGEVWEIQVTGDQESSLEPVRFTVQPENSTIIIDGEENQIPGTQFDTELTTGSHFIQLRKKQHEIIDDSITVQSGVINSYDYELEEISPITVLINSNPQGASIYLNDEQGSRGVTPQRLNIYPGNVKIRLTMPNYSNLEDEFEFTGENTEFNYNLQRYIGFLTVNSTPTDATVLINDEIRPNPENLELTPGAYFVEVVRNGYDTFNTTVDITQGDSTTVNAILEEVTGSIFFVAQQPEMQVTLKREGQVVDEWVGSKALRDIPAGSYEVTATLNNFSPKTQTFNLGRDENKNINFDLSQIEGRGSLTIDGVFSDADVTLIAPGYTREYSELPINLTSIGYGNYVIEVEKDGFDDITKEIEVNSLTQEVTFVDEFNPRGKGRAMWRSLVPGAIFPGLGHGYLGKGGRGFLYFLGGAAAIGWSVKSYLDYQTSYENYQESLDLYNGATNPALIDQYKADYRDAYDQAQLSLDDLELGLTVYAAVKGLELFDLLLQRSNKKKLREAKLEFNAKNNGLSMRVNF